MHIEHTNQYPKMLSTLVTSIVTGILLLSIIWSILVCSLHSSIQFYSFVIRDVICKTESNECKNMLPFQTDAFLYIMLWYPLQGKISSSFAKIFHCKSCYLVYHLHHVVWSDWGLGRLEQLKTDLFISVGCAIPTNNLKSGKNHPFSSESVL